ncbi:hypothetical protein HGRIS_004940 [Hohenbuehelia grisea]|uniref:Velvet domain-containing protein n=1 Tax=Hohenbuehelia grisea TaxID=104357 RepID=A0ABR3JDW7_9AGAR
MYDPNSSLPYAMTPYEEGVSVTAQAESESYSETPIMAVGMPIAFEGGKFRGRIIQSELRELQHATVGRKFALRDRRPIDPPPVVLLKFFEAYGKSLREIQDYGPESLQNTGIFCTAELDDVPVMGHLPCAQEPGQLVPGGVLVGSTTVESTLVHFEGRNSLMFAFNDLAVRGEGYFRLKYRMFDVHSMVAGMVDHPIQAETFGGIFRVFSTREFPGLPPITRLSEALSRAGVPISNRDRGKKRSPVA